MVVPVITDKEFVEYYEEPGKGPTWIQKHTGVSERNIFSRRRRIEQKIGRSIVAAHRSSDPRYAHAYEWKQQKHPQRYCVQIKNGLVIAASDFHYWPSVGATTAHRALVKLCKELEPDAFIANGDVLDFPGISRWDKHSWLDWERQPRPAEEIEHAQDRLHEIRMALPRKCKRIWPLGNHDTRLEWIIANKIPDLAKLKGVHLKDHFPDWEPCWGVWINDHTVVKHDFKGGIHDIHNNIMWAGTSLVTGHTHQLNVRRLDNYRTQLEGQTPLFGVNLGMVADPYGPQFTNYTRDNPKNWASGFCVLTFRDGKLMWPEVVRKWDENRVEFRGQLLKV